MKIRGVKLNNFKRFTDLTINLFNSPKLVVLVGPNGCGKSSVFDAFEQIGGREKPGFSEESSYLRKDPDKNFDIKITTDQGDFSTSAHPPKKSFYLRSSYRYEADFHTKSIGQKDEVIQDSNRPKRMIDLDTRVKDNYERLVGNTVSGLYSGKKDNLSVSGLREELIGKIRASMLRVFPNLVLESIGNPFEEGQFFFKKGDTGHFSYKNLSSGEKAAFDIILDLIIKSAEFDDTIIAIDEPELHMHSELQQALLTEIYAILPNNCQIWIATHSIGFIRGAISISRQEPNDINILDFSGVDFDQSQVINPARISKDKVRQIFSVAIDDLSNMVTPSTIVMCEGSLSAPDNSSKKELDTEIYNTIFSNEDVGFISGNDKIHAQRAGQMLFDIIKSSGSVRNIISLVDRDDLTVEQIVEYQGKNPNQRFLARKTIENYLMDSEVIDKYCNENGISISSVTSLLVDPVNDSAESIQSSIKNQLGFSGDVSEFKKHLALLISPDMEVYKELFSIIAI